MMNKFLIILMLFPFLSHAGDSDDIADHYFSKKIVQLTPQERTAISIGKKWQTGTATSKPVAAEDGSIAYVYGSGQTQILCAVLQVCDVAL